MFYCFLENDLNLNKCSSKLLFKFLIMLQHFLKNILSQNELNFTQSVTNKYFSEYSILKNLKYFLKIFLKFTNIFLEFS